MTEQELALQALRAVDFDWTMHIKSVWRDSDRDVDSLHAKERARIISELEQLKGLQDPKSPLGMVLIGEAGSGKTHLLSAVRKHSLSHELGFILVDMTDVHNFWETVLQGYISSLQEAEADGIPQFQKLIECLIALTGTSSVSSKQLAQASPSVLNKCTKVILSALAKRDRQATIKFQDVIRALLLLNSNDFVISGIGYNWLQGLGIEEEDKKTFNFMTASISVLSEIVEGLSWIMSLRGPSVLALDQLDAIVTQHHFAAGAGVDAESSDEQRISKAIIEGIGGGLMALRDKTSRTLILVSCLETTWKILEQEVISTFRDRFRSKAILGPVVTNNTAKQIVTSRLQEAYASVGFSPLYSTWPFSPEFFNAATGQYPRRILQRCDKHREKCLASKGIVELHSFKNDEPSPPPPPPPPQLDRDFAAARNQINLANVLEEQNEDKSIAMLLRTACECLVRENPTTDSVDVAVEADFPGGKNYPLLHARVRLVFRDQGDREKHLCLRALQRSNANAYQTRLKAAMTASGIDRSLSFRRLMIVRTQDIPGGATTQKLTKQFEQAGGLFANPTEDELRTLLALQELQKKKDPNFEAWLRDRRPVSQLPFMQDAVTWLFGDVVKQGKEEKVSINSESGTPDPSPPAKKSPPEQVTIENGGSTSSGRLPLGAHLVGKRTKETISIPVDALTKHTIVLAGSGSGKTVLVRRLVEEAALLGIPAIVIDGANDLARMGDRWSTPPDTWSDEDRQKAERYHQNTQVAVWTPGREAGNPLSLEPLPDLAAVKNDSEELDQAADMARDALQEIVAPGKSQTATLKRGILKAALMYFAKDGGGRLPDFIELLSDLPLEAGGGIADAGKKAQAMADSLRAEILNNPLLRQSGSALDPSVLFGLDQGSGKTRISILNFVGLSSLGAQQQFLNQLFMTLFTWIKKNPAPKDQPLRGLLVLDEAKDFVPSIGSTPCKASLNRLAAQARKYGLGLIFATQAPKSIDHNIIANCSTQFYGRANSPAAIEVIEEQLRQRGGSGQDIARLERGQFYAASESVPIPTKVLTPLCLSYHPSSPLDELEVLERAKTSRNMLQAMH